jgi:hypothetical protein
MFYVFASYDRVGGGKCGRLMNQRVRVRINNRPAGDESSMCLRNGSERREEERRRGSFQRFKSCLRLSVKPADTRSAEESFRLEFN